MGLANKLFKGDRTIWIVLMFLCAISVIEVFSAMTWIVYNKSGGDYGTPITRHIQFWFVGLAIILLIQNIPCRFFSVGILLLPLSLGLLLYVQAYGVEINGSKRWIKLFGVMFQPSEIAKLSCVIYIAFFMSNRQRFTDAQIFKYILLGVIPVCGLIFTENLSTAVMIFLFCFLMMFIGQISLKRLGGLFLVCILAAGLFVTALFTVQPKLIDRYDILAKAKHRIENFFEPEAKLDPKTYVIDDDNRQKTHAKMAIAGGGIGKLPGLGQQRNSLALAHADFIYAIIIEELGVAGGLFVLLLYIIILFRAGMIARKCEKLFPKYLVLGCGLLIGIQAFSNMAVVVGLIPVTGQPLPLISHGGTSAVITCIYIGMILSVSRFSAGIGNEEEEEEEDGDDETKDGDRTEIETGISEDNPMEVIEEVASLRSDRFGSESVLKTVSVRSENGLRSFQKRSPIVLKKISDRFKNGLRSFQKRSPIVLKKISDVFRGLRRAFAVELRELFYRASERPSGMFRHGIKLIHFNL